MEKYRKLRNGGRKKALFGMAESSAILAAAGIQAAATTAAATIGRNATINAAKQQADTIRQQTKAQEQSIKESNELSNQQQENMIQFVKEQNEAQNDIQRQMLTQMAIANGQQNTIDRLENTKIKFRNGGRLNGGFPLRGSYNGLRVTDGGTLPLIGITPEGFPVRMAIGDDHEHYHKTKGGKYRSGVGLKLQNGTTLEVEGNQSSPVGEIIVETPNGILALSKHSIKGYNPVKDVLYNGQNPIVASNIQENIKDMYGIKDGGKAKYGCRKLRNGGRIKAELGYRPITAMPFNLIDYSFTPQQIVTPSIQGVGNPKLVSNTITTRSGNGSLSTLDAGLLSAGIGAVANIAGTLLTNSGNNRASSILADAYSERANILGNAYRNLRGIDLSLINRNNYRPVHSLAVVRAPIVTDNGASAAAERSLARQRDIIARNNLSGAAMQSRLNTAEINNQDIRTRISANAQTAAENIRQNNTKTITEVGIQNANRDVESQRQWANDYLKGLIYNNDIANKRILGEAEARSGAANDIGLASASAATKNAMGWGNTLNSIGNNFGTALNDYARYKHDERIALMGSDITGRLNYDLYNLNDRDLTALYNVLPKDDNSPRARAIRNNMQMRGLI